ncbi:deoxyguanosine kinase 2 [Anguillid herpesvirus 1]|uniref:Deoxyguanosine kinase 2 n=1 Tax=Anguillid herpesvirus 1 TaxID=150286 RepID=A0A1J0REF3_9VIRU|nr:deoxyguanosine kinase 2 [Anguillid herpesvirus 1]ADA57886.1 deoxyguanosine kinase 2 [Anguillid herpesvirus 1]APD76287.1 deoxyguanosine kinase 2 [Anguillid herpesvirus 1]QRM16417.1 deoxyguanosine kinase 2 [Anguillid herpesvirus 1]QRM16544.1 deoxyguanosine kinase 2 [Anguillid herpesvirus 1]QRM16676.1 deoxyguanosine kinase 2 [Anguillid herpesvirus 1]
MAHRLFISVEGGIGIGKSTFVNELVRVVERLRGLDVPTNEYDNTPRTVKTALNVKEGHKPLVMAAIPEPVNLWRNFFGHNVLEEYLKDQDEHTFPFSTLVTMTMFNLHSQHTDARIIFSERCPYSNLQVFSKRDVVGMGQYRRRLAQYTMDTLGMKPDCYVYMKADPELIQDRIKKRGRPEEAGIDLEAIKSIHELHERWLIPATPESATSEAGVRRDDVLVINCNGDVAEVMKNIPAVLEFIRDKARTKLRLEKEGPQGPFF